MSQQYVDLACQIIKALRLWTVFVFCSVHEDLPSNSATVSGQQPSSLSADNVFYALDSTTYRHTIQDVIYCRTALLRMRRLLQQVVCQYF